MYFNTSLETHGGWEPCNEEGPHTVSLDLISSNWLEENQKWSRRFDAILGFRDSRENQNEFIDEAENAVKAVISCTWTMSELYQQPGYTRRVIHKS